jgi:ATP-dependent exoDNAse (exonuclease V) alpha subunit
MVDQAHILATPGMDRHSAYVGLTRHREGVQLIMAAMILPTRANLPEPCRANGQRTWRATTDVAPATRSDC